MAGKKVFTNAGELLAKFLVEKTEGDKTIADLNSALSVVNSNTPSILEQFNSVSKMSKEEIYTFFEGQLRLELDNFNITDGEKEVHIQELVQKMQADVKYDRIQSEAQFHAIVEVYSVKLADIIRTIGVLNRAYQVADRALKEIIMNMKLHPLDYFIGGDGTDGQNYFRFQGNKLSITDGTDQQLTEEVLRVSAVMSGSGDSATSVLGSQIQIGGTTTSTKFDEIILAKKTTVHGDLSLVDGELQGTAVKARYADLAEYYTSDEEYQAGSILMINIDDDINASETTINNGTSAYVGIVSDAPGFILNESLKDSINPDKYGLPILPIVLTGRTPVRVHTMAKSYGQINKGDILFPSPSIDGVAIAVPFIDSQKFMHDHNITPLGLTLESSKQDNNECSTQHTSDKIQLIIAKIN